MQCVPTRNISGFQEGLWQGDVAEVFLLSNDPSGYVEYNFAAGGAWWAASFSGPRKLSKELPDSVQIVETGLDDASWWIRTRLLNVDCDEPIVGNVCGILGAKPRRYITLFPLSEEIDFHRPGYFKPLYNV